MSDSATKDDLLGAEDLPVKSSYTSALPNLFSLKPIVSFIFLNIAIVLI